MTTPRHRHFVALPLLGAMFLVLTGVNIALRSTSIGSTVTTLHGAENIRTIRLSSLTSLALTEDAEVTLEKESETVTVRTGEVLMRSMGVASLRLSHGVTAHVLNGALAVVQSSDETTVVALNSPVLIESGNGPVILPPGHQQVFGASARPITSVPTDWLLVRLQRFPEESFVARVRDDPNTTLASFLRSPSLANAESLKDAQVLAELLLPIASARPLFAFAVVASGRSLDTESEQAVRTLILESPSRDAIATTITHIAKSTTSPIPATIITLWSDEVVRLATHSTSSAVNALTEGAEVSVRALALGFPVQAERWEHAVRTAAPLLAAVSEEPEQRTAIARAESMVTTQLPFTASLGVPKQREEDSAPVSTLDPHEMIFRTREMLVTYGVLHGGELHVVLDALRVGKTRVTGAFIARDGTLLPLEFSFYYPDNKVSDIKIGDENMPNAISAKIFFQ